MKDRNCPDSVTLDSVKSHFRVRLKQRMVELKVTASELARESGVSRSVLSGYLSDTLSLPTTFNLLRLSAALRVDPAHFLATPAAQSREQAITPVVDGGQMMTITPQLEALMQQVSSRPDRFVYYLPGTLPEPLKTNATLRAEYGPGFGETMEQYRDFLRDMLGTQVFGAVLLDAARLQELIKREGRYAGLTPGEANAQLEQISDYATQAFPHLQIRVTDFLQSNLNPCFAIGEDLIVVEFFGRIIQIEKGMLLRDVLASINRAMTTAESLQSWLDRQTPG